MQSTPKWQAPLVQVLRLCGVDKGAGPWPNATSKGDVRRETDKALGRSVLSIRGRVSAANFLKLPREGSALKLSGEWIYLELRRAGAVATIHVDVKAEKRQSFRVSVSTLFSEIAVVGNSLKLPWPVLTDAKAWVVLRLNLKQTLGTFAPDVGEFHHTLRVTLGANLRVRDVFTSDNRYDSASPPENLRGTCARTVLLWVDVPSVAGAAAEEGVGPVEPKELEEPVSKTAEQKESSGFDRIFEDPTNLSGSELLAESQPAFWSDVQELHKLMSLGALSAPTAKASPGSTAGTGGNGTQESESGPLSSEKIRDGFELQLDASPSDSVTLELPTPEMRSRERAPIPTPAPKSKEIARKYKALDNLPRASPYAQTPKFDHLPLEDQHGLRLKRVIGFSESSGAVWMQFPPPWGATDSNTPEVMMLPCDKILVSQTLQGKDGESGHEDGAQQLFRSHSAQITLLKTNEDHSVLLTAQATDGVCILWGPGPRNMSSRAPVNIKKLCQWTPHVNGIDAAAFSAGDEMVVTAGQDANRRTQIIVWGMQSLIATMQAKRPKAARERAIVARQVSDFEISEICFSPWEPLRLVSCGRENVRFWRIKRRHLPACPAILQMNARDALLTGIGFSKMADTALPNKQVQVVLVTTSTGSLLQIDYRSREVLQVLRLHSGPITSFFIGKNYAVTGSEDSYLRVWPLEFSDYLLEAKHNGDPVTGVAVSLDESQILVTTSATIGVLSVGTQEYRTSVRSHRAAVSAIAIHEHEDLIATSGEDSTIRVWKTGTGTQMYEFTCHEDTPVALSFMPSPESLVLACGFDSGYIRCFDVPSTAMLCDRNILQDASVDSEKQVDGRAVVALKFRKAQHGSDSSEGFNLFAVFVNGTIGVFLVDKHVTVGGDQPSLWRFQLLKAAASGTSPSECPTFGFDVSEDSAFLALLRGKVDRKAADVTVSCEALIYSVPKMTLDSAIDLRTAKTVDPDSDVLDHTPTPTIHYHGADIFVSLGSKIIVLKASRKATAGMLGSVANASATPTSLSQSSRTYSGLRVLSIATPMKTHMAQLEPFGRTWVGSCISRNGGSDVMSNLAVFQMRPGAGRLTTNAKAYEEHYTSVTAVAFDKSPQPGKSGLGLVVSADASGSVLLWETELSSKEEVKHSVRAPSSDTFGGPNLASPDGLEIFKLDDTALLGTPQQAKQGFRFLSRSQTRLTDSPPSRSPLRTSHQDLEDSLLKEAILSASSDQKTVPGEQSETVRSSSAAKSNSEPVRDAYAERDSDAKEQLSVKEDEHIVKQEGETVTAVSNETQILADLTDSFTKEDEKVGADAVVVPAGNSSLGTDVVDNPAIEDIVSLLTQPSFEGDAGKLDALQSSAQNSSLEGLLSSLMETLNTEEGQKEFLDLAKKQETLNEPIREQSAKLAENVWPEKLERNPILEQPSAASSQQRKDLKPQEQRVSPSGPRTSEFVWLAAASCVVIPEADGLKVYHLSRKGYVVEFLPCFSGAKKLSTDPSSRFLCVAAEESSEMALFRRQEPSNQWVPLEVDFEQIQQFVSSGVRDHCFSADGAFLAILGQCDSIVVYHLHHGGIQLIAYDEGGDEHRSRVVFGRAERERYPPLLVLSERRVAVWKVPSDLGDDANWPCLFKLEFDRNVVDAKEPLTAVTALAVSASSGSRGYQIFVGSSAGNLIVYDSLADTVIQFATSSILKAGVTALSVARGEPITDMSNLRTDIKPEDSCRTSVCIGTTSSQIIVFGIDFFRGDSGEVDAFARTHCAVDLGESTGNTSGGKAATGDCIRSVAWARVPGANACEGLVMDGRGRLHFAAVDEEDFSMIEVVQLF